MSNQEPSYWIMTCKANKSNIVAFSNTAPDEYECSSFCVTALYKEPIKSKPLSPYEISKGNKTTLDACRKAFVAGVKFAEKHHKIGGEK